jgi:hypothetical protein
VCVDEHRVVPARVHPARFGERGRDVDLVAAGGEGAADQDSQVLDIVEDENPWAR